MDKDEWKPGHSGIDPEPDEQGPEEAADSASERKAESMVPYMELHYMGAAAAAEAGEQEMAEHDTKRPSAEDAEADKEESDASSSGTGEEGTGEDEELNRVIEDLCRSKAQEFRMLGYEHVTGQEIWECVSDKYNKTGIPPLHRIVNDILSLKVTQFMNWMTMSIYKDNAHFR
ncbi:post-transcriptional regulator [Paenibacillus naphthalenovorans]|uniref:post-transcriptional regulator n=1 Tax=Paenibacillus naphthalenovorans TaxID=162209 RepID=UPI00087F42CA|nr:Post-transcriptional regulator [Paenibacillus naphthalenovorans]